jgi:hypothetical protein
MAEEPVYISAPPSYCSDSPLNPSTNFILQLPLKRSIPFKTPPYQNACHQRTLSIRAVYRLFSDIGLQVTLKSGASKDELESAKKLVTEQGGKITKEFSLINGFTCVPILPLLPAPSC